MREGVRRAVVRRRECGDETEIGRGKEREREKETGTAFATTPPETGRASVLRWVARSEHCQRERYVLGVPACRTDTTSWCRTRSGARIGKNARTGKSD